MATSLLKLETDTKHTHTHTQCPTLAVVTPENKWIWKNLKILREKKTHYMKIIKISITVQFLFEIIQYRT